MALSSVVGCRGGWREWHGSYIWRERAAAKWFAKRLRFYDEIMFDCVLCCIFLHFKEETTS